MSDGEGPQHEQDAEAIVEAIKQAIDYRADNEERIRASGTEYADLPIREITLNQVIAFNMAYFRKAAGLKQEELGERLAGWVAGGAWSKAAVSAAERSWDGKRIRQFDADLIYGLSKALMVPIGAMFLPPDSDGVDFRYVIVPPHEAPPTVGVEGMGALMEAILTEGVPDQDVDPGDDLWAAYQSRMKTAAAMYLSGPLAPAEIFGKQADEAKLAEQAARLRGHYDALRGVLGELDGMLEVVYARMAKAGPKKLPVEIADPAFLEASRREQGAKTAAVHERQENEVLGRHRIGDSVEKIAADLGWSLLYVASVVERASKEGRDDEAT